MVTYDKSSFIIAYVPTLRDVVLSYVRSLKCEIAALLHESLFPVIHYLLQQLCRLGLRDHLIGESFGLNEDLSGFAAQLFTGLGKSIIRKILF